MKKLYQVSKKGKVKEWQIYVEPVGKSGSPEVVVVWGFQDGKKQTTREVVAGGVNEGKANSTTALQQANLLMERAVREKLEDGYTEELQQREVGQIDWTKPLSQSLVFYKPKNSIDESKIQKLEKASNLACSVKRDGICHIARKVETVEIYSRRMDLMTEKYPHLIEPLNKLPYGTIFIGELIYTTPQGQDDFRLVSSVCRSLPEEAIRRQEEFGPLSYYVFDVAFYKEECLLTTMSFGERRQILEKLIMEMNSDFIMPSEIINKSHSNALLEVINRRLEGLVVWDKSSLMDQEDAFTFTGKANRPSVVFKSKPIHEQDFIIRFDPENGIGDYGKGKNTGLVGNVFLYQLDDQGNEVFISKCGGGLKEEQRKYYTDKSLYPRVWAVEYGSVQPGTGSLRFPVFNRDRTLNGDKTIEECVLGEEIKQAKESEEEDE